MKLQRLADTISTYLTLVSALLLPLVLLAWVRSYMVSDRYYRAEDGLAVVAGCSNGELSLWTASTPPHIRERNFRSREATWGWTARRTFQRLEAREHFWVLGFGYATADVMPWRNLPVTSTASGLIVPLWFVNAIAAVMPLRLLARNTQSSEEFLAQRAAEQAEAAAQASYALK